VSYKTRDGHIDDPTDEHPSNYIVKQGYGFICKCGCEVSKCYKYPKSMGDNIVMRDCDWVFIDSSNCKWGRRCTRGKNLVERFNVPADMIIGMKKELWP